MVIQRDIQGEDQVPVHTVHMPDAVLSAPPRPAVSKLWQCRLHVDDLHCTCYRWTCLRIVCEKLQSYLTCRWTT